MILTHGKVFLMIPDPLWDFFFFFFYSFNPLGMLLRVFLSFLDVFLNFPLHFQPSGNLLGILEKKNLFILFFYFLFSLLNQA